MFPFIIYLASINLSPEKSKTASFNKRKFIETRPSILELITNNSSSHREYNKIAYKTSASKSINDSNKGRDIDLNTSSKSSRKNTINDYSIKFSKKPPGLILK